MHGIEHLINVIDTIDTRWILVHTIDINLKTKRPLTETVTVIVYATYSSDIGIEDGRVYVQNF